MAEISIKIPEDLKKQIDEFEYVNWSAVAREAIKNKLSHLVLFKSIVSKSKLTEKDAIELGRKINKGLAKRYKQEISK